MANPKNKVDAGAAAAAPAMLKGAPAGWKPVPLRRARYAAEGGPCTLELHGVEVAESVYGPFEMLLGIVTSEDAPAFGGPDGKEVVRIPKGSPIFVIATAGVRALRRAATDPDVLYEIYLEPSGELELPGGKKMKTYNAAVNPETRPRSLLAGSVFFLPPPEATLMLTSGQGVEIEGAHAPAETAAPAA